MFGYNIIKDISEFNHWTKSVRYKSYIAEKNGAIFLLKVPQDEVHQRLMQNEVRWRQFFDTVPIEDTSYTKIAEVADEYIAFEWIDAEHLSDPEDLEANLTHHIDRLAGLFVALDTAAENYSPTEDDTEAISEDSVNSKSYRQNMYKKFTPAVEAGVILKSDIDFSLAQFEKIEDQLELRYQHGDFTPWHIFVQGDQWLIYDAEHANTTKFRFTDIAHTYMRTSVYGSHQLASKLLKSFVQQKGSFTEAEVNQLIVVLLGRSLGSMMDAFNDDRFHKESRVLFERVKKLDLSIL